MHQYIILKTCVLALSREFITTDVLVLLKMEQAIHEAEDEAHLIITVAFVADGLVVEP